MNERLTKPAWTRTSRSIALPMIMMPNATHNSTVPSGSSTGQPPERLPEQPHHPRIVRRERPRNVTSAGGIIFRRRNRQVEIFFVKNALGKWTFPKGKQQLG